MLSNDLVQAIYNYLMSKPMAEVRSLVEAIEKQVKEDSEKKELKNDT